MTYQQEGAKAFMKGNHGARDSISIAVEFEYVCYDQAPLAV
jgi:hypothetical protein